MTMADYQKLSTRFKSKNQRPATAKPANPAKASLDFSDFSGFSAEDRSK